MFIFYLCLHPREYVGADRVLQPKVMMPCFLCFYVCVCVHFFGRFLHSSLPLLLVNLLTSSTLLDIRDHNTDSLQSLQLLLLRVNLRNFPSSTLPAFFAISFHIGIAAVLSLYVVFWLKVCYFALLFEI